MKQSFFITMNFMSSIAIVLHGPTSAGKSSIASSLQDSAQTPAFHVTLDAFVTMSRRCDMRSHEEQQAAYRIHCANLRLTLARLLNTHFEIVLDTVLREEAELKACIELLSARPLYFVGITAPLYTLEQRERERKDRLIGMASEQHNHSAFDRAYDLVIDTSSCTPDEGAAAIRDFIKSEPRH